jgi:hypothetical protein
MTHQQSPRAATKLHSPTDAAGTDPNLSPAPWRYEYSPYRIRLAGDDSEGTELPAYEIVDAEGNKVFDTDEDMPGETQEANARLAAAAPELLAELAGISDAWDNAEGGSEVMDYLERRIYTIRAAIARATNMRGEP